jgi:ABC-type bacteriocin/lantibiotic exporter with double-glycine peptidase domain
VFDVIDRVPSIRDQGEVLSEVKLNEQIKFENITFRYPTAAESVGNVLENATFRIKAGTTTAIVGPSGSGKSTIAQLIERFYTPATGNIYFDD